MSNAFVTKLMAGSALAFILCLLLIQQIAVVSADEQFKIVITSGETLKGSVCDLSLVLQTETAGTVVSPKNEGLRIPFKKFFSFKSSLDGIRGDVCSMMIGYTGGSAKEWSVHSVSVQSLSNKNSKKVTFEVNKTVKINEMIVVDNCKNRENA